MDGIIKHIKSKGTYAILPPGSMLTGNVQGEYYCYLMDSGMAVVYAGKNHKPLNVVNGSYIFGLNQLLYPKGEFVIKIINSSIIYSIPAQQLLKIIDTNHQWPALATHLSRLVFSISATIAKDSKQHNATLISQTINMLHLENEEVRLAYTVLEYVMDITGLSRSTVVRALDVLKQQGVIKINNGLLMSYTP